MEGRANDQGTHGWTGLWGREQGAGRGRARWARPEDGPGRRGAGFRGPWGMGGPGFGFPFGGPGRPRPRRGDVRLAALSLLAEQPMHGYQIITELTERSGGVWRPSPGSIYPTLQQLEDEGLVTASEQDGRRTFSLTESGRAEVQRASEGRRAPWEELADEEGHRARDLRAAAAQVMGAVVQVASAGSERQRAKAERLLNDTRKALYRLLAEDDGAEGDGSQGNGSQDDGTQDATPGEKQS